MSIVLILRNKNQEAWANALKEALPNEQIEIFPDVQDPNEVSFAVCWQTRQAELDSFPSIKVLQSLGAGVEHILDHIKVPQGVKVTRIVDHHLTHDMFEFILGAILYRLKLFGWYADHQRQRSWKPKPYRRTKEVSVGILGLGILGAYTAEKLASFGFTVRGWSTKEKTIPGVYSYTGSQGFKALLSQTDFLVNLLPLTAQTRSILNRVHLSFLPRGAFLINVARGGHLNEEDLLYVLDTDHLSGAMLDVFTTEPLPRNHPFWGHPKIQMTPHIASRSDRSTVIPQIADNFRRMKMGQPLKNEVDVQRGY